MKEYIFKPFASMKEADYETVGFKSGLEVHQQLLTVKKLFCRCPAGRYSSQYDAEILRHMRPTLSELGEYDGTALMEFKTRKEIIYRINRNTVCTYEMDDTPPFEINEEALDSAIGIGMLYGCSVVDEIHIARKQYLDGSIPTGFQRTSIVSLDGKIPFRNREIRVLQLSIEEDACREVSDIGHRRVYLTDRLGMPLIETVTGPDMRTPLEVAEVAEIIRRLARTTGRVRTGIGAAREDVNVSVTGGTRIEIKGVSRIPLIPLLTYNEAMRQWNLLRLRDELARRGVTTETFQSKTENITRLLRKTRFSPILHTISDGGSVQAVVLRGFAGLLRWQTQTGTFFSKEISDRLRVIACLTTLPNIIHSDSPSESIAPSEWQSIRRTSGASDDDTVVLVWGEDRDSVAGAKEVIIRAREATIGIPSETRQALRDGTNGFERILPGPDRMYPDTDLPPKRITEERRARIRATLPEPFWNFEEKFSGLKIPADTVRPLAVSPLAPVFEKAIKEWKINPTFAAVACVQFPKRIARCVPGATPPTVDLMTGLFSACRDGKIIREGVYPSMKSGCTTGGFAIPPSCGKDECRSIVGKAIDDVKSAPLRNPGKAVEAVMGRAMNQLRGRIPGAEVEAMVISLMKGGK
jgi:glutamyl-tRNA(Gln) amidotransferase subunit E